jgi:hypothetical protein
LKESKPIWLDAVPVILKRLTLQEVGARTGPRNRVVLVTQVMNYKDTVMGKIKNSPFDYWDCTSSGQ